MRIERSKAFRRLLWIALILVVFRLAMTWSDSRSWRGFEMDFWLGDFRLELVLNAGFAGIDWDYGSAYPIRKSFAGFTASRSRTDWIPYSSYFRVNHGSGHLILPLEAWILLSIPFVLLAGRFSNCIRMLKTAEEAESVNEASRDELGGSLEIS